MQALLVKLVKFALLTLALVALAITASAAEPTAEQLELMKQYGLSVPPVVLDENGKDKALIKKESPKIPDIANDHVAAKEEIKVHATENGKQIDVTFSPFGDPFELPVKKITKIEIVRAEIFEDSPRTADESTFESRVEKSSGALLVDFYADWCTPCRNMAPDVDAAMREMNGIRLIKVDVDQTKFFVRKYGVTDLPCMMIFVDGKLSATRVGQSQKDEIKRWIVGSVPQCGYRGPQSVPAVERVVVDRVEYQPEYRQERPTVRMFAGRGVHE